MSALHCFPGKEEACLRVAVADASALPAWAAGSDRFVLALNFLCSTLPHMPVDYAGTILIIIIMNT